MKWFKHDSMANRDAKLEKVLLKYGADGYALYWLCLELIVDRIDRDHVSFELEHDAETLGARLKVDTLRVEEIMKYFISLELFEHDHDRITCMKLAQRLENAIVKAPELRVIQAAIRENNTESPGKSGIIPENPGQIRLEEIRREEKKEEHATPAPVFSPEPVQEAPSLSEYQAIIREEWDKLGGKVYPAPDPIRFASVSWRDIAPCIKGIHSDEVLQAIRNFGTILSAPEGKYYWTQRITIGQFFTRHLERFLPGNFNPRDFETRKKEVSPDVELPPGIERIIPNFGRG